MFQMSACQETMGGTCCEQMKGKLTLGTVLMAAALSTACVLAADNAKLRWVDMTTLNVEGRPWNDTETYYCRLPSKASGAVPASVYNLSKQTAGMLVRFVTDATNIHARWVLTSSNLAMPHMAATGVSGLDLYVRDEARWRWLAVGRPTSQTNSARLVSDIPPGEREYILYLPLYNGVNSVEIGVAEGCKLVQAGPWGKGDRKPVVFYGTSIQQGGCASRPGMVHSSILGRRFNWPTINLGFSGSGRMEMAMADLIAELDASVYVLDCLPNMTEELLKERFEPFVRKLRAARLNTPIVIVEDRTYSSAYLVGGHRERHERGRAVIRECYKRLRKEGWKGLYYVEGDYLLGRDEEGTVDGSHPTDLGFMRQADVLGRTIGPLLKPGR